MKVTKTEIRFKTGFQQTENRFAKKTGINIPTMYTAIHKAVGQSKKCVFCELYLRPVCVNFLLSFDGTRCHMMIAVSLVETQ